MENDKVTKLTVKHLNENNNSKKPSTSYTSKDCKIYTPEIIIKYKNYYKTLLKLTNDKTRTNFIMYNKVWNWYRNDHNANLSMEKIYIKTKLGSYTSGECGIGASLIAGLTASGVFSYMDSYVRRLGPFFLAIYVILVLFFGVKVLSNEDSKVEMYNMFLEVINKLEEENKS